MQYIPVVFQSATLLQGETRGAITMALHCYEDQKNYPIHRA